MRDIYQLLSDGSKAVLRIALTDAKLLKESIGQDWFGSLGSIGISAEINYQPRNKSKKLLNNCPKAESLGLICVDDAGALVLQKIDPAAQFVRIETSVKAFHVYRSGFATNPFDSLEGIETTFENKLRLRRPGSIGLPENVCIFRLTDRFEDAESTYCTKSALDAIKSSGVTGFSAWSFSERVELRL